MNNDYFKYARLNESQQATLDCRRQHMVAIGRAMVRAGAPVGADRAASISILLGSRARRVDADKIALRHATVARLIDAAHADDMCDADGTWYPLADIVR